VQVRLNQSVLSGRCLSGEIAGTDVLAACIDWVELNGIENIFRVLAKACAGRGILKIDTARERVMGLPDALEVVNFCRRKI